MDEEFYNWAHLPSPVLAHVFSFVPPFERGSIAAVCRSWNESLDTPMIWRRLVCSFFSPSDVRILHFIKRFGHYVTYLRLELYQHGKANRKNALKLIDILSHFTGINIKLTHFSIRFKGENPLFYAGVEFTESLIKLFDTIGERREFSKIRHLNLSGLQVILTDPFIDSISLNCFELDYLNILNRVLVCKLTPFCIGRLVSRCRKLTVLHTYGITVNDSVLGSFTEEGRAKLTRLGLVCRRENKYSKDISTGAWYDLIKMNPDLRVEFGFDHTCPHSRIAQIMKPGIPVVELHLATFSTIYPEIRLATRYYSKYLERVVVHTRPSEELDYAILSLAESCKNLRVLYIYCIVNRAVIDRVLSLHPKMEQQGSYILKSFVERGPWTLEMEDVDVLSLEL